jgi:hypothetical protein
MTSQDAFCDGLRRVATGADEGMEEFRSKVVRLRQCAKFRVLAIKPDNECVEEEGWRGRKKKVDVQKLGSDMTR